MEKAKRENTSQIDKNGQAGHNTSFTTAKDTRRLLVAFVSAVIMAANINTFVNTGNLKPGGVTGLSILIQGLFSSYLGISIPYTLINLLLNAFPVYIGLRYIGKKFTLFSVVQIILSSVLVDIIPSYVITTDPLLIAIFGGIINGFAISICLISDLTTGGTDFIGIYLSQKKGVDSFNLILGFNAVILLAAGLTQGWRPALYSIIFQFVSTQVMHLMYRNYQQQTLFIVTNKAEAVCNEIYRVSGHGATILPGYGSYQNAKRDVVYSVIAGSDSKKVLAAVKALDPDAFVNSFRSTEIRSRFFQKPKD